MARKPITNAEHARSISARAAKLRRLLEEAKAKRPPMRGVVEKRR